MKKSSDKELLEELQLRLSEYKTMQKKLKNVSEELKNVNQKLKDSEKLKSHFISHITNEIVNPFASILGLSKNILSDSSGNVEKVKNMAALIHSEAFNLDFQLKNIFSAAKIEAGEYHPDVVRLDIKSMIESVVETFTYQAEQKQLTIKFDFNIKKENGNGFYFITDPEKLKLIVSNLVNNSIKFSNAASKVEIAVSISKGMLKLVVKDYGIGLEKADLKIIFDRFTRLDKEINSLNTGHGLGLAITKASLDLLGGSIEIKSVRNVGSTFIITVPESELTDDSVDYATDDNEFFFDESDVF